MTSDRVADWSPDEIAGHYRMGRCHVMALALARLTGLPLGIMWSGLDWHVEPDEEGLGGVREVVHVYVDCGDGQVLDVSGLRQKDEMRRDFAGVEWDVCPCEPADEAVLAYLVEQVGNLVPYDEDEILEAIEVVDRDPVLSGLARSLATQLAPSP